MKCPSTTSPVLEGLKALLFTIRTVIRERLSTVGRARRRTSQQRNGSWSTARFVTRQELEQLSDSVRPRPGKSPISFKRRRREPSIYPVKRQSTMDNRSELSRSAPDVIREFLDV